MIILATPKHLDSTTRLISKRNEKLKPRSSYAKKNKTLHLRRPQGYLSQIARHFDIVPRVVVELPVDGLHDGLEGPGAQVDDEGHGAILQRQVDVVCRLARVEQKAVALPRLEGQSDLVAAALDGVLGKVVAEVLGAAEGGDVLLPR